MDFQPQELQAALKENVPPKFRSAYDRVVLAGMKLLFDKKTNQKIVAAMNGKQAPDDLIAENIAGLVMLLFKQSKNSIPQQVLIPAAIDLALQFAEFMQRVGTIQVDEQVMASALQKIVFKLFEAFGVKQDQLMSGISKMQEIDMRQKRMGGQNG